MREFIRVYPGRSYSTKYYSVIYFSTFGLKRQVFDHQKTPRPWFWLKPFRKWLWIREMDWTQDRLHGEGRGTLEDRCDYTSVVSPKYVHMWQFPGVSSADVIIPRGVSYSCDYFRCISCTCDHSACVPYICDHCQGCLLNNLLFPEVSPKPVVIPVVRSLTDVIIHRGVSRNYDCSQGGLLHTVSDYSQGCLLQMWLFPGVSPTYVIIPRGVSYICDNSQRCLLHMW